MLIEYNIIRFNCSKFIHVQSFYKILNIIQNLVPQDVRPKASDFEWMIHSPFRCIEQPQHHKVRVLAHVKPVRHTGRDHQQVVFLTPHGVHIIADVQAEKTLACDEKPYLSALQRRSSRLSARCSACRG